ncbi:MAG: AAA family ATPase [Pseudomonadota bacterium]
MLRSLKIKGFKSLADVDIVLPRMAVLFGPNTAGKSNLLDAVQALSRLGTSRTLADALADPIRGYPIETFSFPSKGLPGLLETAAASFSIEAKLAIGDERFQYRVEVAIQPSTGGLSLRDEYLAALTKSGAVRGNPQIEKTDGILRLRRKSKPAHPRHEDVGLNHTLLSDPRLGGAEYRAIEKCRNELTAWRTYYLDPRVAMRAARPPADVTDIGVLGEAIAPFLFRLRAEKPKRFDALRRTLRLLIPSVEELSVDLDTRRGTLDILVRQDGIEFSSRIVSEGTLRVMALCAIAVNPWSGALLAFEEPENGVHPRRIELIVRLLASLADQDRQVIVTTHSPLFCSAVLDEARAGKHDMALLRVRQGEGGTEIVPFDPAGPLFTEQEIAKALTLGAEDGLFERLLLRGLLDA